MSTQPTPSTSTSTSTPTFEPGYRAVLVREETKSKFKDCRFGIDCHSGITQERHFATAALELTMALIDEDPGMKKKLIQIVSEVIQRDMEAIKAAAA